MSGVAKSGPLITGIGIVAPSGIGAEQHWGTILESACRLGPVTSFDGSHLPLSLVGEVPDFDETAFVDSRLLVQTDRGTWLALAATQLALADALLDPREHDPYELSVVTASASGGNAFGQKEIHALWRDGPRAVSAYQSIGWFYAASSGQISIRDQLKGACSVLIADSAGGIDAVAAACRLLRRDTKVVLVGGTEAPLSPYALACQASQSTLSLDPDPTTAYRPFSPDGRGYVPAEGGAMLVLEEPGFAVHRGAPQVYAQVAGTAATHDAHHPTQPPPDHRQLARAMRDALQRAGCQPSDVGVVFADGAGDLALDRIEAAALVDVFGPRGVPVTVPKTITGRSYSGGAALDLATAALALTHQVVPPTANVDPRVAEGDLDLVAEPRRAENLEYAVVVARGTGGFNSVAVLRAVQ